MSAQLVGSQFAGDWVLFLFSAETSLLTHKGLRAFWLAPVEKRDGRFTEGKGIVMARNV